MPGQGLAGRIGRGEGQIQAREALPALWQRRGIQGASLFRVDLCVGDGFDAPAVARELGIDMIASTGEFSGAIRRVASEPASPAKYPYLVVSDRIEDVQRSDLVLVQNFEKAKEKLKKKIRAGAGLEVQVSQARSMDAKSVAKWLGQVQELYRFCKLARCQLVITSGATSQWNMVSGRSFDALLKECGIEPPKYWQELGRWLESRLERRIMAC